MTKHFVYPDFLNSIVGIPHTILEHFEADHEKPAIRQALDSIKDRSQIVLFVADGFGQNLLKNRSDGLFARMSKNGCTMELATVFPSATPPALTTLHTGLLPREHGLLEWNIYFSLDTSSKVGFMLTADHGQVTVSPRAAIYLNQFPEVTRYFKKGATGRPIFPSGGARDVFLNIEDEHVDRVVEFLQDKLGDVADVLKLNANSINALFGKGEFHPAFLNRLGNVLVLPRDNNLIWYEYYPGKRLAEHGDHGGLAEEEMYVPFITAYADKLKEVS